MTQAIDASIRKIIAARIKDGVSSSSIARALGLLPRTVQRISQHIRDRGTIKPLARSGRPRKWTPRKHREVYSIARKNPGATRNEIGQSCGVPGTTCRDILKAGGFSQRRPKKKAFLSAKAIKNRKSWAEMLLRDANTQGSTFCFSDESTFELHQCSPSKKKWMKKGQEWEPNFVATSKQCGGGKQMVWGCITNYGVGPLIFIEGSMNAAKYQKLLTEHFLPYWADIRTTDGTRKIFIQDNAPCHRAHSVTQFLSNSSISVLPWAPYSPDANPIENLWALMKRKIASDQSFPRNLPELRMKLLSIWNSFDSELVSNLVESFLKRLRAIKRAKGKYTKY